jgi:hypothetical protein
VRVRIARKRRVGGGDFWLRPRGEDTGGATSVSLVCGVAVTRTTGASDRASDAHSLSVNGEFVLGLEFGLHIHCQ